MSRTQHQEPHDAPRSNEPGPTSENPYGRVVALIEEWLADDSGYDEEVGPLLEEELRSRPLAIG